MTEALRPLEFDSPVRRAPAEVIVDDEIILRLAMPEEAGMIAAAIAESRDFVGQWQPAVYGVTEESLYARMQAMEAMAEAGAYAQYNIFYVGQFAGQITLHTFVDNLAHIAGWRTHDMGGRGIITRAVRATAVIGFTDLGLSAIKMQIAPNNTPSRRVAERVGAVLQPALNNKGDVEYLLKA